MTPYLKACGPPALVAMLPPICDCSAAPGSGGKKRPFSRASRRTSAVRSPASTQIRHRSGSKARTRVIRSRPRTTPPSRGTAPAAKPGAAPARHDRHLVLVAPGDDAGDLLGRRRQRDRVGAALDAAVLGRVRQVGRRRRADRARPQQLAELRLDLGGAPPWRGGTAHSAEYPTRAPHLPWGELRTLPRQCEGGIAVWLANCWGAGRSDIRKGVRVRLRVSVLWGGRHPGRGLADAQAVPPLPREHGAGGRDGARPAQPRTLARPKRPSSPSPASGVLRPAASSSPRSPPDRRSGAARR